MAWQCVAQSAHYTALQTWQRGRSSLHNLWGDTTLIKAFSQCCPTISCGPTSSFPQFFSSFQHVFLKFISFPMKYAVLPDEERWPHEYVQLVFDGEPTAEVPHLRGLSAAERRRYAGAHLAPVAPAMGSVHCIACCMLHAPRCAVRVACCRNGD